MLYDVLPPFAFFTSLGGIILVVSRVMVRIRRQEYATHVQAAVDKVRQAPAQATDLARIIGPSKKSVHIIKNRLTLLRSASQATVGKIKAILDHRPQKSLAARSQVLKSKAAKLRSALRRRAKTIAPGSVPAILTNTSPRPKPRLTIKETLAPSARHSKQAGRPLTPLEQAQAAITAGHHDQAENLLVPHIADHPRDTSAYILLGRVACLRQDWPEALEIFEQVIKLDPNTRTAYADLGMAAFEAGKFTKAIEALQRAHSSDPTNADVIRCLLTIAQRMDNAPMQRQFRSELAALAKKAARSAKNQPHPAQ